jgi:hypothetical protein
VVSFPRSKTRAGLQPVALGPELARALTRRRARQDGGPDDLVFPGRYGQEMIPAVWRRLVFKPAAERAGVPAATPHMFFVALSAEQKEER